MCRVVKIWVSDAWIYSSNPLVVSVMPNRSGLIGIFSITSSEVKEKGHLNYEHTLKYCDIKQGKRILFFGHLNSRFHWPWCHRYFLSFFLILFNLTLQYCIGLHINLTTYVKAAGEKSWNCLNMGTTQQRFLPHLSLQFHPEFLLRVSGSYLLQSQI